MAQPQIKPSNKRRLRVTLRLIFIASANRNALSAADGPSTRSLLAFIPNSFDRCAPLSERITSFLFAVSPNTNYGAAITHGASAADILDTDIKRNEWGIPDSDSLKPLCTPGSKPLKVLPNGGRITLVGSGPGDPDLLTLKAHRLLTDPSCLIIADRLVSQEILNVIPGEVKIARKLPGCQAAAQEELFWWAYQGLIEGKHVIRLKIGDPFVFGRGGEEVLKFRRFGVEAAVTPGVSSAFAAPLLGSIPVTHRGVSNQVVMCTGYGRDNTSPDLIQYHKEQTIVFLMAVGRLRELCERLVKLAGYPLKTPVGIVERAGCPDQRTVVGNIKTIADLAEIHNIKPPSTIIVGEVVNVLLEQDYTTESEHVTGLIQNMTATHV